MNTVKLYPPITLIVVLLYFLLLPVQAATLHVVLVGDTNDDNIGRSVEVDLVNLRKLVGTITENTGLTANLQTFQGNQLGVKENSTDQIKQALQTLNVGPQDVVMFYYSGHGGRKRDQESKWPLLAVAGSATRLNQMLDLNWVINTLQQMRPRLWIAIADACNSVVDRLPYLPAKAIKNPDHYKKLFLDYQGHIIASSSKAGQYSYGSAEVGGLYTHIWLDNLNQELSAATSTPDWKALMQRADKPIRLSQANKVQQPQSEVQVTLAPLPPLPATCAGGSCSPQPGAVTGIGACSQNQYGLDPKDQTKECCIDDSGIQICVKK